MWNRIGSRLSDWTCLRVVRAHSKLRRLEFKVRDQRGAITIEYILIIALIAIIIITLFTVLLWPFLKLAVEGLVQRITDAINGGNIE